MPKKNILLIEPGYPNKYPPLGLMKIAAYHGPQGSNDRVLFVKGRSPEVLEQVWDRVYVTTLFSFEWKRTSAAIDFALQAVRGQAERVFVGGIAATLMFDEFLREPRWAGVRFIKGLLDQPPADSLQLSEADGDFGAQDVNGPPIEELVPDYGILEHIEYEYPVRDAYFGYASRGCVRKCSFCGVPKLEGGQREMPPITNLVLGVGEQFGPKKDLILMDNNVAASTRYQEVIAEIHDLGFERGAVFQRPDGVSVKRRVDFNQGVDARILAKTPMYLREMEKICIDPLRIAFDHVGMRRVYERSVEMAADHDLRSLSNYMLYNFMDTPSDLYQRMLINIELNARLGVRIWSFPMRYLPVTMKDRSHVGKHWNRYYLRSFQIMLQATHGVVSGSEDFFHRAFGDSYEEFERLLSLPHAFIFQRDFFEHGEGKPVLDDYHALLRRFSPAQQAELTDLLNQTLLQRPRREAFARLIADKSINRPRREVARFQANDTKTAKFTAIAEVFPA
ncbi:MAG: radical SAM protein, partial [Boseongicola sp. SB0673_bin_14]|nr:radical SAM protein [Boseongicola sp. SB0673_bin_14]